MIENEKNQNNYHEKFQLIQQLKNNLKKYNMNLNTEQIMSYTVDLLKEHINVILPHIQMYDDLKSYNNNIINLLNHITEFLEENNITFLIFFNNITKLLIKIHKITEELKAISPYMTEILNNIKDIQKIENDEYELLNLLKLLLNTLYKLYNNFNNVNTDIYNQNILISCIQKPINNFDIVLYKNTIYHIEYYENIMYTNNTQCKSIILNLEKFEIPSHYNINYVIQHEKLYTSLLIYKNYQHIEEYNYFNNMIIKLYKDGNFEIKITYKHNNIIKEITMDINKTTVIIDPISIMEFIKIITIKEKINERIKHLEATQEKKPNILNILQKEIESTIKREFNAIYTKL